MSLRKIDRAVYRIVDASLDRSAEGLRVVMDIVRFALDDKHASEELRLLRHRILALTRGIPLLDIRRLESRDSEADVGQPLGRGAAGRSLAESFLANIHRAQEAVRSLEETIRTFGASRADGYNRIRYRLYDLEKQIYPKVLEYDLTSKLDFDLYVVTGPEQSRGRSLEEVVRKAIAGGAGCIQLRAKSLGKRELLEEATLVRNITAEAGVTFIVNDHLDVAIASEADGVHLGQDDFPISEARTIVGPGMIIGASTHSVEQAQKAEREGADLLNVGPIYPTQTKAVTTEPVGVNLIAEVKEAVSTPQTCMGGINLSNVREVILKGAERPAVVSAVCAAEDIEAATRALVEAIRKAKEERDAREDAIHPIR